MKSVNTHYPTASPGRYSLGRLREDIVTARTINPNHEYYESSTYEDKRAKTFGSLKAAPRGPDSVVSEAFEKLPPKNVGKPRNVTNKITTCARKHNQLNYKSNIPFGFG